MEETRKKFILNKATKTQKNKHENMILFIYKRILAVDDTNFKSLQKIGKCNTS